jgi:hypothetical protein
MGWEGLIFVIFFVTVALVVIISQGRGRFPIRKPDREAERKAADAALGRDRDRRAG